jgi:hypothetical protein
MGGPHNKTFSRILVSSDWLVWNDLDRNLGDPAEEPSKKVSADRSSQTTRKGLRPVSGYKEWSLVSDR